LKFVVAPNPFKGSLGAPAAAAAMARGIRQVFPAADVVEVPVADGGEGTVEALVAAHRGSVRKVTVEGPLGEPVEADFGLIDGGAAAVVELAAASGLTLVPPDRLDPRRASTYGFGQLLQAARSTGVRTIIAGIGGSATNDGGAGMAQALGYRLLDAGGSDLDRGGAALAQLERIERGVFEAEWSQVAVKVACDVTNPLTGPEGASRVYGPQKGADEAAQEELDQALVRLSAVIRRDLGVEVESLPGAGAAGGAGAGLVAFLGADLVPGAPLVVEAARLDAALSGATAVFTGEGRVDGQTAFGKGPFEVARRARAAGVPAVVLGGQLGPGWEAVLEEAVVVLPVAEGPADLGSLERDAGPLLERAAARACRLIGVGLR
jgi:glycerate kinase